jgi:hypothetical protein
MPRLCRNCGKRFERTAQSQRYCDSCRDTSAKPGRQRAIGRRDITIPKLRQSALPRCVQDVAIELVLDRPLELGHELRTVIAAKRAHEAGEHGAVWEYRSGLQGSPAWRSSSLASYRSQRTAASTSSPSSCGCCRR